MPRFLGTGGGVIYSYGERRTLERALREAGEHRKAERPTDRVMNWRAREVGAKSARKPFELKR